jgi:HTH-type transcriptional regulator, competence development regulator
MDTKQPAHNSSERGLFLKEWREYCSYSQAELARLSGVSRNAINRIENGARDARPDTVRKLAKALGIEPHQLRQILPAYGLMPADLATTVK